jgi:hypothetical protein
MRGLLPALTLEQSASMCVGISAVAAADTMRCLIISGMILASRISGLFRAMIWKIGVSRDSRRSAPTRGETMPQRDGAAA